MEGVDFSVDRGRLLPGAISAGSLATLGGTYVPEGGHVAPLGRSGAGVSGVPELGRAGTPSGLSSLGQYQNRYFPSVSMHSPGTNYTMVGSFVNGATHSSEALKSVGPDLQQYWSAHPDGYPRYIINNNVYSPYLSYLPATESLSLFAHNSGPSVQPQSSSQVTYHRIYDLHKDPYAAAVGQNVAAGLYGVPAPPVPSQTIRLSPEQMLPSGVCLGKQENTSRYTTDNTKHSSESTRRNTKNDFQQEKIISECKSSSRDSEKHDSSKRNESKCESRSDTKKESKSVCKTRGHVGASFKTKQGERKGDKCRAEKKVSAQLKPENVQKTNVIKPMPSSKAEKKSPLGIVTKSNENCQGVSSPCVVSSCTSPIVTTLATITVTMSDSIVSLASSGSCHSGYLNGTEAIPSTNSKLPLNVAQTTETFSLPYYHTLFAHSQHGGQATSLENKGEFLQTTAPEWKQQCPSSVESGECDRKIKTENGGGTVLSKDSTKSSVSAIGHDCERQNRIQALKKEPKSSTGKFETACDVKCSKTCKLDLNQNGGSPNNSPKRITSETTHVDSPTTGGERLKQSLTKEYTNAPTFSEVKKTNSELLNIDRIENVQLLESRSEKQQCKSETGKQTCAKNACAENSWGSTDHTSEHSMEKCKLRAPVPLSAPSEHRKNNIKHSSKKAAKCVVKSVPKFEHESELKQGKINPDIVHTNNEDKKDVDVSEKKQEPSAYAIESIPKSLLNDRQLNARPGSAPPATLGMKPGDSSEKSPEKVTGEGSPVAPIKEEPSAGAAMNIPVGIAVARQRQGLTKSNTESRNGSDSAGSEDEATDRSRDEESQYTQEAKDREEFLRQQKSLLASTKALTSGSGADIRNELPANLILTGSANGTGVPWQDDPTSRHFTSQWLQSSHLNPASWLGQNPYAMNSAMPTSGPMEPSNLPYTVPAGFKLAQDPVTGQIFLLPATNLEMFDPTRLWSGIPTSSQVPSGHHSPFPSLMATQQTTQVHQHIIQPQQTTLQQQVLPQDRTTGMDFALMMQQYQHLQQLNPPRLDSVGRGDDDPQSESATSGHSVQSTPSQVSMDSAGTQEKSSPSAETPVEQPHSDKDKILSVQPNTFLTDMQLPQGQPFPYPYTSAQLPFMYNSGYLPLPGMPVPVVDTNIIKSENCLQSRGTSPMALVGTIIVPEEDSKPVITSPTHAPEYEIVHLAEDDSNSKPCDNESTETTFSNILTDDAEVTDICSINNNDTDCTECQPVTPSDSECVENIDVTCDISVDNKIDLDTTESDQKTTSEKPNELAICPNEMAGDSDCKVEPVIDITKTNSEKNPDSELVLNRDEDDIKVVNETGADCFDSSAFQNNYNPYTDPLILQAADGLELLSALAEQRSKCPNLEREKKANGAKDKARKQLVKTKEAARPVKVKHKRSSSERSQISFHKKENKENKIADSFMTVAGDRIPLELDSFLQLGTDTMDAIELDMRLRLAELQRRYKEKQRELARLHTKREKERDDDKHTAKRGPGRPRKRHLASSSDGSSSKSKSKELPVKKKKLAEELVDRVFRKTGRSLQLPLSKKANAITTLSMFKNAKSNSNNADGGHGQKTPTKENFASSESAISMDKSDSTTKNKKKLDDNKVQEIKHRKRVSVSVPAKKGLWKEERKGVMPGHIRIKKKAKKLSKDSEVKLAGAPCNIGRSLKCGLGLLAKFAANATAALNSTQEMQKKKKRKKVDEGVLTIQTNNTVDETDASPVTKRDSDVDTSDTVVSSSNQKRKPGRPKKRNPSKSQGQTETIVAKKSKNFGLMRLQEIEKVVAKRTYQNPDCKIKLDGQTPLKPLYLDDEWTLRRSERIFLSEPSPQPSPNFTPVLTRTISSQPQASIKSKSEMAKLQKAKNIQELSQKVKRKYSKNFNRKSSLSSTSSEIAKQRAAKVKVKYSQVYTDSDPESDFSSEGDNVPLSLLKARPLTPEPRCCMIHNEELHDKLRVLLFMEPEGLFYEGEVKEIRPPDVYGVVIDNQRGNRPHIYSQEEILKLAVIDVKPGSGRYLPEGTRICAYWSQQFSCLYPGTISKASPNPHGDKNFVNVEFDDGDTGKIPLDHIRMLPQDFPSVSYDPSPLLLLGKRRRHTTSDSISDCRKSISDISVLTSPPPKMKRGPGRPPKIDKEKQTQDRNSIRESVDECSDEVFRFDSVAQKYQRDGNNCKLTKVTEWENQRRLQQEKQNGNKSYFKAYKYKVYSKLKQESARKYHRETDRSCDMETNPLIRASAFDVKKFAMASKMKARHHVDNDTDSSDDYSDSSNDSDDMINVTSGNQRRFQDMCEFSDDSGKKDRRQVVSQVPKCGKKSSSSKRANEDCLNVTKCKLETSESTENKAIVSAFFPTRVRQLWTWSGKSTKRPGLKGKAKKEFYKSIVRSNETITIGDCAVFLSTGRPNLPYVGRIESLWEGWGGQMVVRVKWFYHPEETKGGNRLSNIRGALFQSPHEDENDVQTISHMCQVLSCTEYKRFSAEAVRKGFGSLDDSDDVYYLAGTYEPTLELIKFEPGVL